MLDSRSEAIIGNLLYRGFCVYLRPYVAEDQILWRVTAEQVGRRLIYAVSENVNPNEAIKETYREVRNKLGISKKRRRRERTNDRG